MGIAPKAGDAAYRMPRPARKARIEPVAEQREQRKIYRRPAQPAPAPQPAAPAPPPPPRGKKRRSRRARRRLRLVLALCILCLVVVIAAAVAFVRSAEKVALNLKN